MKKIILVVLLAFAFVLNFLPHLHYAYPLHVDEWVHFTYSEHISDSTPLYFGGESDSLEAGFHFLLAGLSSIGIPYLLMFRFFPALFTVLICLAMFISVRKFFDENTALFSVLFVVVLKSSVALLGPMFLVPLSLGLFFIPMALYLVDKKCLFLVIASALIIHPPSGIALLVLVNCYLVFKRENVKGVLLQQLIGVVLASPLFLSRLGGGVQNLQFAESFIPIQSVPSYLGYVVIGFSLLGFYLIVYRKRYVFFLYPVFLLFLAFIYYYFKANVLIFYERNLMYLFESFAIPFGVGCAFIVSRFKRFEKLVLVLLVVLLLVFTVPGKVDSTKKVYYVIDGKDYESFVWIKDNIKGTAVLDPWKAISFTPVAGREVYSRIPQGPDEKYSAMNLEIAQFFSDGCSDAGFLQANNISIVYGSCNSTLLKEVHPSVYVPAA